MKVYISVDIEGVVGSTDWRETELGDPIHARAARQMKEEALAACRGAIDAGADEIYVHDAHDSGLNMWIDEFPENVTFIRSWTYTPDSMFAGIDESFDAGICIGYHSEGGSAGNPLAHTMDHKNIFHVRIDGEYASEMEINRYICAKYKVPMVFVSGDISLCEKAKRVIPGVTTVWTKDGNGAATFNRSPKLVLDEIQKGVKEALLKEPTEVPEDKGYELEICYREHPGANKASYYPGVERVDAHTVRYQAKDLKDLVTTFYFIH